MRQYYDQANDRLVFEQEAATPEFWERQWEKGQFKELVLAGGSERFVSPMTRRFLSPSRDVRVLDGGCGRGNNVYSLHVSGYDAYGVDYAEKTVKLVNEQVPRLKITVGDVRQIPFDDAFFDGYWSLGVIEHFFDGYDPILSEMKRVIKPGGFLFLVFPYISPFRRLKINLKRYLPFPAKGIPTERFYQFALNDKRVTDHVAANGFKLRYRLPYEGLKGFKDEAGWFRPGLQWIYDHPNLLNRALAYALTKGFAPFSSHTVLLVFERRVS